MSKLTLAYDALNAVIWLPTGSRRLRSQFVNELRLVPGQRALELGCGTGQVTSALVSRGVQVVAVDRSSSMLDRARARAPSATFVKADVESDFAEGDFDGAFDVVVLAFVLHELADETARVKALSQASEQLTASGLLAILDWSLPRDGWGREAWRRVVGVIEPNGASDVLDECLAGDVATAGLAVTHERSFAGGRASMILAARR